MELQDTGASELDVTKPVNAMVDRLIKRRILAAAAVLFPDEHPQHLVNVLNDSWDKVDAELGKTVTGVAD